MENKIEYNNFPQKNTPLTVASVSGVFSFICALKHKKGHRYDGNDDFIYYMIFFIKSQGKFSSILIFFYKFDRKYR